MGQNILFASTKDIPLIARALDSDLRRRILALLQNSDFNISELCNELNIPQSTCTMNVQILEKANLIHTRSLPAKTKGSQKLCSINFNKIMITLVGNNEFSAGDSIETEMPIGLFSQFKITPPCGLISDTEVIGYYDSVSSFLDPSRSSAELLWFSSGFVEYLYPKNFKHGSEIKSMEFSAELCSEYPGHKDEWPSDITLWINGHEIGTWTSPGDMGGKRGLLTPQWWKTNDTQSGFLKTWKVDTEGSWMDGQRISNIAVANLGIEDNDSIILRLGVKENAKNRGGINIFGSKFGNYPQDLKLVVHLLKNKADKS